MLFYEKRKRNLKEIVDLTLNALSFSLLFLDDTSN